MLVKIVHYTQKGVYIDIARGARQPEPRHPQDLCEIRKRRTRMNNERTSYFKRGLVMLMAFIMVFTYMPGGTWGTDKAWATEPKPVSSAEEFATMSANGSYKLTADITVTAPYAGEFTGTFDGDGHTVTLAIERTIGEVGLFASLAGGAVVKNVTTAGNVSASSNYVGGVAGSANTYAGAIKIENCKNTASVSGNKAVGGILGYCVSSDNSLTIKNCANTGAVTGSNNQVGGIVGNFENTHIIKDCYNTGNITGFNNYAGIIGRGAYGVSVENCYTTGTITAYGTSTNAGYAIIGGAGSESSTKDKSTITNCYALQNCAGEGSDLVYTTGIAEGGTYAYKAIAEMKSADFADTLGSAFMVKAGDYPALTWETPTAKAAFDITPAGATLSIDGKTYTGSCTAALAAGRYGYTVSCEGYVSKEGSLTVTEEQANSGASLDTINVSLSEDADKWGMVNFTITPAKAKLVLKDGEEALTAQESGAYKVLKDKTYTYTVTADGYEEEIGRYCFDTDGNSKSITLKQVTGITLGGTYKTEYVQGDKIDTTGLVVTAALSDGANQATKEVSIEDCTVTGFDSSAVAESQTITVSYKGKTAAYTVRIGEKLFPSSVFNGLKGKATVEYTHNTSFTGEDGQEFIDDSTEGALKSNSAGMNSSRVTVTIKFNGDLKTSKLKFQYKVSSEKNYDYLKINSETSKSLSGTIDWTAKELTVKGGDTVTIAYVKDSNGEKGSDCVWLKDFQIKEMHSISISPKDDATDIADATIVLKDSESNAISADSDGKYYVVDGTYTYTVSKFGYADATGEIAVDGADIDKEVAMTKLATYKATFSITLPEGLDSNDTSVELKSGKTTMTANTDGSYILPAGEYSYTITHPYCDTVTGSLTIAASDVNQSITLERKLVFEDIFAELSDSLEATDDVANPFKAVKDEAGNYLESTNNTSKSKSKISLTIKKAARLDLEAWVSSGGYSADYGLIVKKNETAQFQKYGESTGWEKISVVCDKDDVVTIGYNAYYISSYSSAYDNLIRVRNFTVTPLYTASFSLGTADATLVVKDGQGKVITAGADGKYTLENGTYSYMASQYGYESREDSFTVAGADQEITVPALTKLTEKTITFSVTPSDAAVTVTHEKQGAIEPAADGSYSLPVGESYKYTVEKGNYITESGTFTVEDNMTVSKTLTYAGEGWDGQTKTEPSKAGDVYQIGTAAELAWFANEANKTPTISGKLTKNINLNGKTWTEFCKYDYSNNNSGFAGTLDGGGYIISGLVGKSGLIDCIAPSGIVKNLSVFGTIETASATSGSANIGGIANTSKGTIENCMFSGKITNNYSSGSTAGIVGRAKNGNTIKNCVSDADIACKGVGYIQTLNLGGIAGYTYGTVENCYFTGTIYANPDKSNEAIGGIVGALNNGAVLRNCYTTAKVTGPAAGIGAVIGLLGAASSYSDTPAGVVSNVHYLSGICAKAISEDGGAGTAGTTGHAAADMKTGLFAYTLGGAFNQDSANINNGYPVLTWQGGTSPVVPEFEQNALADMNAIVIKDKTRADALEAEKDEYFLYRDEEITTEDAAFELWKGFVKDESDPEYSKLTWDDIYAYFGIDLTNDGTLSMDGSSIYNIPETCTEILLPTAGEKGSTISWTSSESATVNIASGTASTGTIATVRRPEGENKTVILTASVKNQNVTKTKQFTLLIKSAGGAAETKLEAIAAKIDASRTYIQPMQMYDHQNITEAMEQYLAREGYEVKSLDGKGIEVSLVSVGSKALPSDGVDYISSNGDITSYYEGTAGLSTNAAIYNDVHFKLALDGKEKEVTMRVHIGWDVFYVEQMLEKVLDEVTWDTIKGDNKNTSEDKNVSGVDNDWTHTVVSGSIDQNLTLPQKLSKYSFAEISWSTLDYEDSQYIYAEENSDGTLTGILQRPPKADEGEKSNDKEITLTATAKFTFWDDYTVSEMTSQGTATEPAIAQKFFDVTIAEGTEEEKADMKAALVAKYPGLIRDFVDKTQSVDLANVTADLQLPRPAVLEDNGIMSDSYNQKVTMSSSNTDVLEFSGYHAVIYRPLPGSDPVTVEYTVTITDRRTKNVLAQNTFEMTVQPLTQKEIDDAAAWMAKMTTEEVYWNGIKGENTDKNNVTSNLKAFEEILRGEDGSVEYVRGTVNITFAGIDVDDLPGYDSMKSQPWREFRSDYNSVIECETLFVTTPEYDTEVTIDSVFTDNIYGKYWEKFQSDEDYAQFAQFYKQPVSVTVTVKGEKGADPNPDSRPTTLSATVSVDGKDVNGFKSTSGISVSGLSRNATAWDAVTAALTKSGYKYDSFGDYISGVTDAGGVTLTDTDTKNSGWLYTVNGKLPEVYMGSYYLKDGDKIVLYYTSDYTKDDHAGSWGGGSSESKVVTTGDKTASTTTTSPTETKVTEKTNADGTREKTIAVTVSAANQTEIIKQAADKKSAEIVLEVASTQAADAQNIQLQLDVSFVKNISDKTDAALTVNTENGTVSLDQSTIKTVLDEAKGTTITLDVNSVVSPTEVQKKAAGESGQILSLTVKSGDKTISDFKTGKVTVTVAISTALQDKRVAAIHIAEDGKIEQMPGKSREVGGKKCYEFTTSHFSDFALVDANELGLETEEEIDAAALVAKLTPVARSAKTAKGYIKVQANFDKSDKAIISELTDAGYTVKYRFYRSTKKSASYKSALTKKTTSYTNTSGKKGTKYYYKVQVRVYDDSGKFVAKTALKQCKYACRIK